MCQRFTRLANAHEKCVKVVANNSNNNNGGGDGDDGEEDDEGIYNIIQYIIYNTQSIIIK